MEVGGPSYGQNKNIGSRENLIEFVTPQNLGVR